MEDGDIWVSELGGDGDWFSEDLSVDCTNFQVQNSFYKHKVHHTYLKISIL